MNIIRSVLGMAPQQQQQQAPLPPQQVQQQHTNNIQPPRRGRYPGITNLLADHHHDHVHQELARVAAELPLTIRHQLLELAAATDTLKPAFTGASTDIKLSSEQRAAEIDRLRKEVESHGPTADATTPASGSDPEPSAGAPDVGPAPALDAKPSGPALTLSLVPEFKHYSRAEQAIRAVVSLKAVAEATARAEVALTCVVDRSGSMEGPLIGLVQETIHFLIDQLTDNDYLGLVSYASDVTEDLPLMRMTPAAKRTAHAIVDALRADGGTALYDGLARGVAQQMASEAELAGSKVVHACFLCTDGQANEGPRDADTIIPALRKVQQPTNQNITVHTFGFGQGHSVQLLQSIADAQSGTYYFVAQSADVPTAYGDALGGLLSAVAKSVKLTVEPLGGARLLGVRTGGRLAKASADPSQPAPPAGGSTTVSFNDIFAEETRESLMQLQLPADVAGAGGAATARVHLSYVDVATGELVETQEVLSVERADDAEVGGADAGDGAAAVAPQVPNELVYVTAARFETVDAIEAAEQTDDVPAAEAALDAHAARLAVGPVRSVVVDNLVEQTHMVRGQIKARFQFNQEAIAMVQTSAHTLKQQRHGTSSSAPMVAKGSAGMYDNRSKAAFRNNMTAKVSEAYANKTRNQSP